MDDRTPLPVDLPDPAALSPEALEVARHARSVGCPLDVYQPDGHPVPPIEEARRWEITDEGAADWAMRMYAAARARAREIAEQAQRWHHQIQAWEDEQSRTVAADLGFFGDHLTRWGQARREADPSTATLHLPSGDVETTKRKATPRVVDKDALVKWAMESRPEIVEEETTYRVPAAAVKGLGHFAFDGVSTMLVTDDGEQVPGVTVEPDRVTVVLRPAAPGIDGRPAVTPAGEDQPLWTDIT